MFPSKTVLTVDSHLRFGTANTIIVTLVATNMATATTARKSRHVGDLNCWTKYDEAGKLVSITLPETNIAPENGPPQKEIHLPTIHFQGPC